MAGAARRRALTWHLARWAVLPLALTWWALQLRQLERLGTEDRRLSRAERHGEQAYHAGADARRIKEQLLPRLHDARQRPAARAPAVGAQLCAAPAAIIGRLKIDKELARREGSAMPRRAKDFCAVDARHHEIEQDDVVGNKSCCDQGLGAGRSRVDMEILSLQTSGQEASVQLIVINDQDSSVFMMCVQTVLALRCSAAANSSPNS